MFADGSQVGGDELLVASGSSPVIADLAVQAAGVEATGSGFTRVDDHLRGIVQGADGRRLAPQILDQTNGAAERFNQQVMAGQGPGSRALAPGLSARSNMPSDGC
ncbi:MAG TPA: hypothetical protein VI094_14220 [Propionibacteriaceae bacterium]